MQYRRFIPPTPVVGAHGAPPAATVRCAICTTEISADDAVMTERIDPDDHTWYTEHLCRGCADPADLLLDRLLREELARQAAK